MNLVQIKDLPKDFPFKIGTLYQWHHHKKFPGVLVKFSGKLCIDMDRVEEIITRPENKKVV